MLLVLEGVIGPTEIHYFLIMKKVKGSSKKKRARERGNFRSRSGSSAEISPKHKKVPGET